LNVSGAREQGILVCEAIGRMMEILEVLEAEIATLASTQAQAVPATPIAPPIAAESTPPAPATVS
jgi:hypothetical protein